MYLRKLARRTTNVFLRHVDAFDALKLTRDGVIAADLLHAGSPLKRINPRVACGHAVMPIISIQKYRCKSGAPLFGIATMDLGIRCLSCVDQSRL